MTSANSTQFGPLPPLVSSFILISVGKFDQFLTNLSKDILNLKYTSNKKQVQQWDQLRIILPHNTFELLTYDTRHGGVIAVKPNPFLECEFATLLLTRALTNGPGCNTPLLG